MKLNNKGFAISGVLYSLLILFVTLFIGILTILATTKFSLDRVKKDITYKLETLTYRDTILNGADPILKEGMIAVTIDADGTVRKADMTQAWYDYDNKTWANAVTVSATNRSQYEFSDPGTVIPESEILTYFVWIPRYRYKLWYVKTFDDGTVYTDEGYVDKGYIDQTKVHSIDIVFEGKNTAKSNVELNGQYLTHPAFTFGGEELNGIWVGKFETGYSGATSTEGAKKNVIDSTKVVVKPNTYAWTNNTISNMFYTALNMKNAGNIFGFAKDSDSHMMKNMEWGAVAYLSHSVYGKGSEIHINNSNLRLTGCGGDSASEGEVPLCKNQFGSNSASGIYNQTTTGNISGIFDMSGLVSSYVMGFTGALGAENDKSGFTNATTIQDKYFDNYDSQHYKQYTNRKLGDATGEMGPFLSAGSSWYADLACFVDPTFPWFTRGGAYNDADEAGIFYFGMNDGSALEYYSFRVVIV